MKQTVIAYYSFSGNNRSLATTLGKQLKLHVIELTEAKTRKSFTFIKELLFQKMSKLSNNLTDFLPYEHVILLTPVWFGKLSNPARTLIQYLDQQNISYDVITLRGGSGDDSVAMMNSITSITDHKPSTVIDLHLVDYADPPVKDVRKIVLDDPTITSIATHIKSTYYGGLSYEKTI